MFWTDVDEKVIVKCHLNGSNATILVDSELAFPGMYVKLINHMHIHTVNAYIDTKARVQVIVYTMVLYNGGTVEFHPKPMLCILWDRSSKCSRLLFMYRHTCN